MKDKERAGKKTNRKGEIERKKEIKRKIKRKKERYFEIELR